MTRRTLLVAGMLAVLLAGCGGGPSASTRPTTTAGRTTTMVTLTTTESPARKDITAPINAVREFVTGAAQNDGRIPRSSDLVDVTTDGDVSGRLTVTQMAGKSTISTSQMVTSRNAGYPSVVGVTIRSTSSDPASTIDILHRSSNAGVDYLLTGNDFRSVARTPWVTVPARYGNGLGCVLPGRQTVCEVTADLLKNQKLDPQLPSNSAVTGAADTTIRSAITVRQVLALGVWRMQKTISPAVLAKAGANELDRTLVPVVLQYNNSAGPLLGRPKTMTVRGRFTVAGVSASIDLTWSESVGGQTDEVDLPAPTKALYTVLNAKQARALFALAAAGY
ncbi:hypothetical protein SAMN04515671_1295 [Nakamurella panacisegetis]|uniref:LppX_LprAFG lipoprotein n=1 Tax=Nakamurella panacisegetis TaxID=1090615 RepID=A0A1H0KG38_9ACTN|nr:hypothetical protein [Nakamurella panacisegetis]SDO54948.1 hypothetical protein SAMN04515671_1295 [Nakamurella panacisegetis]